MSPLLPRRVERVCVVDSESGIYDLLADNRAERRQVQWVHMLATIEC